MNIFTKFQPHMYETDIITVSKVYCCSLSATVCTYDRFFIFSRFLSSKQCFRVIFRALHDKRTPKNVLHRQIGDLDMWTHLTSWPRMTSEVWNGLKLLVNGWNTNFTARLAVTQLKPSFVNLRYKRIYRYGQLISLWPDLWRHRWPGGQPNLFFTNEFSRAIDCRFRVSDQMYSFGVMGGSECPPPPQRLVGGEEAQRLPG